MRMSAIINWRGFNYVTYFIKPGGGGGGDLKVRNVKNGATRARRSSSRSEEGLLPLT